MSVDVRLIDYNYVFDNSVTLTATSSDSEFPVANLKSFTRAKLWRSSGYFKIVSTNKYLNFKESGGGSELTAILTIGEYTPDELETEIKARLEDAGAETYTVSYSTVTGRWTISHAGSFLSLLSNTGTNIANSVFSTIGFDVASDHTGATTYTGADIAIHTEEAVVIDLNTSEAIDSVGIFLDPLIGNALSNSAVVTLQASQTNAWTSPAVSQTLTYDSEYNVYTHFFTTDQEYRYWRVKIVDPSNANLYVELHKVFLGKSVSLIRNPSIGFKYAIKNQSKLESTDYGHQYADIYPDRRAFEFNLPLFEDTDLETLELSFKSFGNVAPVMFAIDTAEELFDKDQFVIYGYMKGDLVFNHNIIDRFSSSITIDEAL